MTRWLPLVAATAVASVLIAILGLEGGAITAKLVSIWLAALSFALVYLITNRPYFSIVTGMAIPITVFAISRIKLYFMGVPFLFWDLVYLLRQNFLELLLNDHRILLAVLGFSVAMLGFAYLLWRLENRRAHKWPMTVAAVVVALATYAASAQSLTAMGMMDLTSWNHKVATFVASARISDPQLQPASGIDRSSALVVSAPTQLSATQSLPDIIVVLEESTFDIRPLIGDRKYKERFTEFFSPPHAKSGKLRVHTFAGATWLAEFALLTGVPHLNFGPGGYYAPYLLEGRISDSLPNRLRAAGYQTIAVYPNSGSFVNARRFYESIGFEVFLDPPSLNPPRRWDWRTPDREIFGATLDALRNNRSDPSRPSFIIALTINHHGPHQGSARTAHLEGVVDRASIPPDAVGRFADYLSRLTESADAFAWLKTEYQARFPGRPAVFVHFGDHHPLISRELARLSRSTNNDNGLMDTYFVIAATNFTLRTTELDPLPHLDIALLSTLLLKSVGIPADLITAKRAEVALRCEGQYWSCKDKVVEELHDLLIARGLVR